MNPQPDQHQYLSIREFSALFDISPNTTRRWITEGNLQAIRLGQRVIRIPATEVDRLKRDGSINKRQQ